MDLIWLLLLAVAMVEIVPSSVTSWNSIQRYLESFENGNAGLAMANTSAENIPNTGYNSNIKSTFKRSPLLSMYPANPPRVYFSSRTLRKVGDPLILTPLLESGKIEEAKNLSMVKWSSDIIKTDIASYTGFFTVNKTYSSNLFFWFIPTQVKLNV